MMWGMAYGAGEVTKELSDALALVRGTVPKEPDAVVVLAWFVDSLAKEYGLSESLELAEGRLERMQVPNVAADVIAHYLGRRGHYPDEGVLRDRLYEVFVELSGNSDARAVLNRNQPLSEVGLLHVAQIYWNLEGNDARPRLPIRAGQAIMVAGKPLLAEIPVPGISKDFAIMKWAARANQRGHYKSSGQGFRNQGARLAVLAAQHLVVSSPEHPPALDGVALKHDDSEGQGERLQAIIWGNSSEAAEPAARNQHSSVQRATILVGRPLDVGVGYQRRGFDDLVDGLWAADGDRRVWLEGGPGLGKSFSAGRVAHEALTRSDPDREALVIWVNSAEPNAVMDALGEAADRLHEQGRLGLEAQEATPTKVSLLMGALATSTWKWLTVFDNADPAALIQAGLVPPGHNRNGRVLVTTVAHDPRMRMHGNVVSAEVFSPAEAEGYLRSIPPVPGRGQGPFHGATTADAAALAVAVGHHPLALAIASSTIVANAMTIGEWQSDFTSTPHMDLAADEPDPGGYPRTLGDAWRVALERASVGLPEGSVARAALVAALQDPDGHPTWLWDTDEIHGWVTGTQRAPRRGGMPAPVRRLVDHGILRMSGTGWATSRLAIHQLAARAVRENADPGTMIELARLLAEQWLLHLTTPGARTESRTRELRANTQPLLKLQSLPPATRDILVAMDSLTDVVDPERVKQTEELMTRLEAYLVGGGVTGRTLLVDRLESLGDELAAMGRSAEARSTYARAAQLGRETVSQDAVQDRLHAELLTTLSGLEDKLGETELTRKHATAAARIYERLMKPQREIDLGLCVELNRLYGTLGDTARQAAIQSLVDEFLAQPAHAGEAVQTTAASQVYHFRRVGQELHKLGRLTAATSYLARAADAFGEGADVFTGRRKQEVLDDLVEVHLDAGDWVKAEAILGTWAGTRGYVLLASLQHRLGRMSERDESLQRAVEAREEPHGAARQDPAHEADMEQEELLNQVLPIIVSHACLRAIEFARWKDSVALHQSWLHLLGQFAEPGDLYNESERAWAHAMLGWSLCQLGHQQEGVEHLRQSITVFETLRELEFEAGPLPHRLAGAHHFLGLALAEGAHPEEAIDHLTRALEATSDREDVRAVVYSTLGQIYLQLERLDDSYDSYSKLVELRGAAARRAPEDLAGQASLGHAQFAAGWIDFRRGHSDEAALHLTAAVDSLQRQADADPMHEPTQVDLAQALALLGSIHQMSERLVDAVNCLNLAVDKVQIFAELAPGEHGSFYLACLQELAGTLQSLGRDVDAAQATTRYEEFARRHPEANP